MRDCWVEWFVRSRSADQKVTQQMLPRQPSYFTLTAVIPLIDSWSEPKGMHHGQTQRPLFFGGIREKARLEWADEKRYIVDDNALPGQSRWRRLTRSTRIAQMEYCRVSVFTTYSPEKHTYQKFCMYNEQLIFSHTKLFTSCDVSCMSFHLSFKKRLGIEEISNKRNENIGF